METTQNHPLNESLWSAVLDLLYTVCQTPRGAEFVKTRRIATALHSCLSLLNNVPSLTTRVTTLLKGIVTPLSQEELSILVPFVPVRSVPLMSVHRRGSIDENNQCTYKLEITPSSQLWLSESASKGVDFLSCLLRGLVETEDSKWNSSIMKIFALLFDDGKNSDLLLHRNCSILVLSYYSRSSGSVCILLDYPTYSRWFYRDQRSVCIRNVFKVYEWNFLFNLDPLCFHSFFYDETITALVETVTNYCSNMDIVLRALKILVLLSQKRRTMIHCSF